VNNLHGTERLFGRRIGGHVSNGFHKRDCRFIALPKDGVTAIQVRRGYLSDEEL
jgi:hypothetical protein